mmetsp:Transcript_22077/g.35124  ORF Transcript_22077/g.35124 Transcript_22077/m.35124 type:complete len:252 (-) Transcript_22077:1127-1882(-)
MYIDLRHARLIDRGDIVHLFHLLDGRFQRLGHLNRHLFGCGSRILGDHNRLFDGEGRIFQPPQVQKADRAAKQEDQDDHPSVDRPINRSACYIDHHPRPQLPKPTKRRTAWPSVKAPPPVSTTSSPSFSPAVMRTMPPVAGSLSTGTQVTLPSSPPFGSNRITPVAPPSSTTIAVGGTRMPVDGSAALTVTVTDEPGRITLPSGGVMPNVMRKVWPTLLVSASNSRICRANSSSFPGKRALIFTLCSLPAR